jgi:PAS domain-containing protein
MFAKQLVHTSRPSTALTEPEASLIEADAVSTLLVDHYGYGQWKVVFPGEVYLSEKVCEIFGIPFSPEPAPLEFLIDRYHADDRGKLLQLIAAALQGTQGFHSVLRIRTADDEERVIESIGDLRIKDGRVTELFGLIRDVTKEVRREAFSISRNRLLQDIVSAMPAPIAIYDEGLHLLECSNYWLKCHKLVDRGDAVGKRLYDLFPGMPPALREENDRALAGDVIRTRRNFINPSTGAKMDCQTVITRWMASDDKVGGLVMLIGWHEFGVAAAAKKAEEVADFDGSLLDLLKAVS